jgi:phage terminase, large subunit, PBSX family
MATTIKVGFNPIFKNFNKTKCRYRLARGSAGSGKSVNIAQDFIMKLGDEKYKGASLLCVRKFDGSNKSSTFAELCSAIYKIYGSNTDLVWEIKQSPLMIHNRLTKNSIIFRGMKDEAQREKVKSITVPNGDIVWLWIEEATELTESDVDILDDRLRGKLDNPNLYYQITFSFNPVNAMHFLKRKYFDMPSDDVFTHHSTYMDNRFIDDAYDRRMQRRKREDPEGYQVYGLGNWGELGGLILNNWEVLEFDTNPSNFDTFVLSQDFGFNHANALGEIGFRDGNLYVCRELYEFEKDTSELIELANRKEFSKKHTMWCDSAKIQVWHLTLLTAGNPLEPYLLQRGWKQRA